MTLETLQKRSIEWKEATSPEMVGIFLDQTFEEQFHPYYRQSVLRSLKSNPHRAQNPFYLKFYTRTILMAAEYGFFEAGAHEIRHGRYRRSNKRDFMDPRHILALAVYLADKTIKMEGEKLRLADSAVIMDQFEEGISTYRIPKDGVLGDTLVSHRKAMGLEVFIPDFKYHRKIHRTGFSQTDAEILSREKFISDYLPQVAGALGFSNEETASIFLNPNENWGIRR